MKDYYKDTVKLWTTTPPYSGYRSEVISWRLYPAIEHSRIKVYYREGSVLGLLLGRGLRIRSCLRGNI